MMEPFGKFRNSLLKSRRFIHSKETLEFLDLVSDISKEKTTEIEPSQILWRAQLGGQDSIKIMVSVNATEQERQQASRNEAALGELSKELNRPLGVHNKRRMYPKKDRATEGRINTRGIPCLYLAGSEKIAVSEMRPVIGSYVSCSQFKVKEKVKIVDCSDTSEQEGLFPITENNINSKELVWYRVCQAFCAPVIVEDDFSEYVITQTIAEKFKDLGYDGVAYKSIFSNSNDQEHLNIALFNPEKADLLNTRFFKVKGVDVTYECSVGEFDPETGNPISVDVP